MEYQSSVACVSEAAPGVTYAIRRMSFRARLELLRAVREAAGRREFLEAGESVAEKLEAAVLEQEMDEVYLRWGLQSIEGLTIDGQTASIPELLERGPEGLCREIVDRIKRECGLTDDEAKN